MEELVLAIWVPNAIELFLVTAVFLGFIVWVVVRVTRK